MKIDLRRRHKGQKDLEKNKKHCHCQLQVQVHRETFYFNASRFYSFEKILT